jgi:hypothetical protein
MNPVEQPVTEPAKTDPEVTTPVQEPVAVEPPAAQGQGSGPWSDDLQSVFTDDGIRTQVDAFLREKVQPYVTQLEQKSKPSQEQEIAISLYDDLRQDPGSTYLAITEELFGEEAAEAIQQALSSSFGIEDEPETPTPDTPLDPRLARVIESFEAREAQEAYDSALTQVKTQAQAEGVPLEDSLFHPFVVSAEGDMSVAYDAYKEFVSQAPQKLGLATEQPAAPEAPPAIGSDIQAPAAPPTEPSYSSLDDALDDFFKESKAAPPVVGSV